MGISGTSRKFRTTRLTSNSPTGTTVIGASQTAAPLWSSSRLRLRMTGSNRYPQGGGSLSLPRIYEVESVPFFPNCCAIWEGGETPPLRAPLTYICKINCAPGPVTGGAVVCQQSMSSGSSWDVSCRFHFSYSFSICCLTFRSFSRRIRSKQTLPLAHFFSCRHWG